MGGNFSRRQLLASAGLAISGGIAGVGLDIVSGADSWSEVSSPTSKTLYAVVRGDDGPYAVGGSGNLLHRASDGWEIVLDDGPSGNNKTLYGAAVTDDGQRVWMCGASGKLGSYDVTTGEVRNWSSPGGISNTFNDVEVTGPVDDERVYLAMGSGETVVGKRESSDTFEWETKDTGGSYTIAAVDFHTATNGRVVSEGGTVYERQSDNQGQDNGWKWVEAGIDDTANALNDVVSGPDHVFVGADTGRVWREDCTCDVWTPHRPTTKDVNALVRRNGHFLGACGSGQLVERVEGRWVGYEGPVGNGLLDCLPGDPDIAVGESGTIIER